MSQTQPPLEGTAPQVLKRVFGYDSFRPGQEDIVSALLAGRDVLAVMPTGAGKSICYQVPALMLPGITVVVSPLVSLMQDQVRALVSAGVKAAYLNNSLNDNQKRLMLQRARAGWYKIIYVAPERLLMPGFLSLVQQQPVSMVTVDEAHCISQWGQDFRPSYLKIKQFLDALPNRPVVGAFTATATDRVRQDVRLNLGLQAPFTLTASFDRPNLFFDVQHTMPSEKTERLLALLAEQQPDACGIVYCSTTRQVDELAEELCAHGYKAAPYHAKLPTEVRGQNQQDFLYDRVNIMVATNAFGMGIDKPNVRFVFHYNMPKDLESYYQEAGRAGRDGDPARCVLLYAGNDVRTAQFLIDRERDNDKSELPAEVRLEASKKAEERLKWMTFYSTTTRCQRSFMLEYFGEKLNGNCGHCGSCVKAAQSAAAAAARAVETIAYPKPRKKYLAVLPEEGDRKLLDALFALRKRLAAKRHLPAFVIFSDATLREMAVKRPQSREELLSVRGVGEGKADQYGEAFLAVLRGE